MNSNNRKMLLELFETGKVPSGEDFALFINEALNHTPSIKTYEFLHHLIVGIEDTTFHIPGIKKDNYTYILGWDGRIWDPNTYEITVDEEREELTVSEAGLYVAKMSLIVNVFN